VGILILSLKLIAKVTPAAPAVLSAAKHLTEHKASFAFMLSFLQRYFQKVV
jgi:hypothetical protein